MERELNIPLIATNDSHYVGADDSRAHEIPSAYRPRAA
jgi:DNA polymerase-3 subunit alpha